jgi:DNA modification methylase
LNDNNKGLNKLNVVYYKSSTNMKEVSDNSIDLIVTSPPYFNIKDYSMDGHQEITHSVVNKKDIGNLDSFDKYIKEMVHVWKESERVLKPNGKLCINVPLLPMLKKDYNTHYNRHIFDLQSSIQNSILTQTNLYLMDIYIWNRTNPTKSLMFGSYPYPRNFYAQNTIEFITIYVKDGKPLNNVPIENKEASKLTQDEWVTYTKQVWDIPIPNKGDLAFGKHSAIMPEEIVKRCVSLYSFVGDTVLDPFAGSGTTLKVAKEYGRNYIGYELYENYKELIDEKVNSVHYKGIDKK